MLLLLGPFHLGCMPGPIPMLRVHEIIHLHAVASYSSHAERSSIFSSSFLILGALFDNVINCFANNPGGKACAIGIGRSTSQEISRHQTFSAVTRPCVWLLERLGSRYGAQYLGAKQLCIKPVNVYLYRVSSTYCRPDANTWQGQVH